MSKKDMVGALCPYHTLHPSSLVIAKDSEGDVFECTDVHLDVAITPVDEHVHWREIAEHLIQF